MSLLEFYVNLRRDILAIIGEVKDSGHSYRWDNSIPNSITKSKLSELFEKTVNNCGSFGVHCINRHLDCGNPRHLELGRSGYAMDSIVGENISYGDSRFIWSGPICEGDYVCKCPCSETNLPSKHYVVKDVFFDVNANKSTCGTIESILDDLYHAKQNSGDNKSRSAIREFLLRAVLRINDAILPGSMDEYIEHQMELAGLKP
jgi:hypothetical protein